MAASLQQGSAANPCLLPFPDRYHAAHKFVKLQPQGAKELSQETQLALFSLSKQITEGPCNVPKPWSWNAVESTKWMAWNQLGNMSAVEAMRLYVRTLDEEQSDWYALLLAEEAKPHNQGAGASLIPAHAYAQTDVWTALPMGEQRKPCPRYEHSGGLVGTKVFIVGGNYAGRYLNDLWSFDTLSMTWQQLVPVPATRLSKANPPSATPFPADSNANGAATEPQVQTAPVLPVQPTVVPLAGHSVNVWGDKLVILGGHIKSKDANSPLPVRIYHTSCNAWEVVQASGTSPSPRGGHSSSLVGNKLYIFGGEDASRRALGDLHILDLPSMMWERTVGVAAGKPSKPQDIHLVKVEGTPPSPRSAHIATVVHDRYIVIFGGGSVTTCFSDVHILDTRSEGGRLRWIAAKVQGPKVSPRAGHTGALVGSTWYILGGGNNVNGCTDLLAIDLRGLSASPPALASPPTLQLWQLGAFPPRHALSSEGVTMVGIRNISKPPPASGPDPEMGMLLAFGGYNGKYQNAINVLRVPQDLPSTPSSVAPGAKATSSTPSKAPGAPAATDAKGAAQASNGMASPAVIKGSSPAAKDVSSPPAGKAGAAAAAPIASKPEAAKGPAGAAAPAAMGSLGGGVPAAPETPSKANQETEKQVQEQEKQVQEREKQAQEKEKQAQEKEKQALRKQLATVMAQLETAQKGMEDARAALGRESAKVLRLEGEAAESHKKLALAAEEHKELVALRRQVSEASNKPQGVRAYLGF
uniref:ACB domain-containing protein n=1 Tax=Dunaliella tertiolecta TaxID=3047 RepID=A0A7S3QKW4_DUNTE|eukprot:CAMPEP_0202409734 /NCGR_PEP_ID=MMETSP1128-20130828/17543_1 /ASSEMBLY_ACC=CAM_ASM_000463 /TAXON_ID=3047 /ORGANISM="Dunaliella tertiolecta, Strain CCMP1320" /LENGTH=753 /DNA_ID=CAMNT_0049015123 /DNA_START=3 /DNA_END=2264 /DNA_ORIENTATION=-